MSATPEPTAGIPAEPVFYANAELTAAYPAAWRNALKAREAALPIALCVANAGIPPAEVSGWISVEERLPEPDDNVLIWSERRGGIEVAGYRPWDADDCCWAIDGTFYQRDEAMHWMPLPACPSTPATDGAQP